MKFYNKYILPRVVNWACKSKPNMYQRKKIVPKTYGNVLEIAIGSGLNLKFYDAKKITGLTGLEPSKEIWELNQFNTKNLQFNFTFLNAYAEEIPINDNTFDSVVITYALCTIQNTQKALSEIKRVLKPEGKLFFCEHGLAPDKKVAYWQNKINPYWKRVGGGCNLNKEIPKMITDSGFEITKLETMYLPGWKPASYNYWGIATNYNK